MAVYRGRYQDLSSLIKFKSDTVLLKKTKKIKKLINFDPPVNFTIMV